MNFKKIIWNIILLNFIFILNGCKSQLQNEISIIGNIKNLSAQRVYLANAYKWNILLDSADCRNGNFTINYKIDSSFEPFIACIEFRDSTGKLKTLHYLNPFLSTPEKRYNGNAFMLEKGITVISGNLKPKEDISIKAGKETDVINKTQLMEFGFINTSDSTKRSWYINEYESIIKENPFSFFLLNQILTNKDQYTKIELERYLTLFNKDIQNSKLGKKLKAYLEIRPNPGVPLTNLFLLTSNGSRSSIIKNDSKLNVLIFWASWCGPCRMEIPQLKSLYIKLSNKSVSMASISTDRDNLKWAKAIEEENMPWPQFILDSIEYERGEALYNFTAIPVTILTDSKGTELLRTIGFERENEEKLELFIEKYLKINQ